ncbi:PP2C-domain-containing protein [Collybia nuda]|uniref:protein-serine/threonine phosphatase n=1 Tax=Collybia nuda TaxID=64659 RepID=A0A9P6CQD6_9AGAR|nr:PP2C-domain-containing protein [Collybia nuda]
MGQTLSSPMTQKHSQSGENGRFAYGISEMQGWRISMEDAHAVVLDLDQGKGDSNAFFAVYDGHGGGTVARFAGQNVHKRLLAEETYREKNYDIALKRAFLGTDEDLLANPAHTRDPSGCTAVAALVTSDGKIYVANAGDSRSVIGTKGVVKPLSYDHKPTSDVEKERIHGAGGYIEYGRVNGNLALSRALGDFEFKKNYSLTPERQIITADPDVTCHEITEEDEFLVIACDGIWDCLSSQQVVDFVRYQVSLGKELAEICEMMCDHCLAPDTSSGAGIGCDNMTVLIIALLHGRTKEEWQAWITDRVKNNYGYKTPTNLPQLYAQSRLMSFRARREALESRDRTRQDQDFEENGHGFMSGSGLGGFARVLGSTGGITFKPGVGILSDTGALMFGTDEDSDEEEEESGDDDMQGRSFFTETLLGHTEPSDPTQKLKAHFDEFEKAIREEDGTDEDGDSRMDDSDDSDRNSSKKVHHDSHSQLQGEAPPPPRTLPNGDTSTTPVEQLKSQPHGDEPLPVVKAEGLLDASEDPLVKA